MLTLEPVTATVAALPRVVRAGLVLLAGGVAADVVAHLAATAAHGHGFSPAEVASHLVVFVGMVVVLLGVVIDGVRQSHPD